MNDRTLETSILAHTRAADGIAANSVDELTREKRELMQAEAHPAKARVLRLWPKLTEIPRGLQQADDGAFTLSGSIQHFSETSLHQRKSRQGKLLGMVNAFDIK